MPVAAETWTWTALIASGLHLLGAATAVHAVLKARTVEASLGWAVGLVSFPYLALPLYWVFGRSKFHGYQRVHRTSHRRVVTLLDDLKQRLAAFPAELDGAPQDLELLEKLARTPFTSGNDVQLLIDGRATFDAIFAAIDAAERYVLVFFFIVKDDAVGRDLQQRLIAKARAGVRVLFGYDSFGSHALSDEYLEGLRAAGAEVHEFKTTRGRQNLFQLNFRNHRKIVVVDGHTGFLGGHNVGDEYVGDGWRDTHLSVRGPAVTALQLAFAEDWNWASGAPPEGLDWTPRAAEAGDRDVLVLPTGPADSYESGALYFETAIHAARERLWIATPYFVPDEGFVSNLQAAALRGVDVRILMPERADHRFVGMAARAFFEPVQQAGGRIFLYRDGFMHQKVVLVDDVFATVGTANFSNRSFRLNFEITAVVLGGAFTLEITEMLRADFARAAEAPFLKFDEQPFFFRLSVRVARLVSLEM